MSVEVSLYEYVDANHRIIQNYNHFKSDIIIERITKYMKIIKEEEKY